MTGALLSEEEAADYLGKLPLSTLRNLVRYKRIAFVRIGRARPVFRVDDLDKYIADHTIAAVENPWGLTDASLQSIRDDRSRRRAS